MPSIIGLTTKTKLFSSLIQQLSGFTATIRISVYPEVCVIDAINESRTSLTKLNLSKEWFDTYVSLTTLTLIVNTTILYKILNVLDIRNVFFKFYYIILFFYLCTKNLQIKIIIP